MSAADIAARLKVSDRTVRRYLSTPPADTPQAIAA
jgi:predicted DNA-binding transcriptional regulator YafY